jgi:RNA polymerase sigma factor (sigma-70 family)
MSDGPQRTTGHEADAPMPSHDEPQDPEEISLSATFRAWGATEDDLPALVARARAAASPRDVWIHHLYETYVDALVRFAAAKIGSIDDAQEVVQEVFIRVVGDLSRYDRTRGAPRAWLYNLTYGLASNRARAIRRGGVARDDLDTLASGWSDLPDIVPDLRRALAALPPECVEVLWLRRVEELSQAETADVLSIPFGTVLSRLVRAERLLREALQRGGHTGRSALSAALLLGSEDLPPELEECIRSLRRTYPLPADRRSALWERVKAVFPRPSARPPLPSKTFTRAAATHGLAASLGVAVAAMWVGTQRPAEPPVSTQKPDIVRVDLALKRAAVGTVVTATTVPAPAAVSTSDASPGDAGSAPTVAVAPRAGSPLRQARVGAVSDREVALQALRRARAALARRAVDDARRALDEADRALGPGDSREHLDSLRVEEALLAGDRARATALVARFRQRYPGSAHLARLEAWTR